MFGDESHDVGTAQAVVIHNIITEMISCTSMLLPKAPAISIPSVGGSKLWDARIGWTSAVNSCILKTRREVEGEEGLGHHHVEC